MKIILASASPRRRELMKMITEDFTAVSADIDETVPQNVNTLEVSEYIAERKAKAVAEKYPDDVVIGCDTTVIYGSKIFGKPATHEDCTEVLEYLSGKTHQVVTGCTIVQGNKTVSFSVVTDVSFRELSFDEIGDYAMTSEPYDKAGGYGIQGKGALFIEKINGDYYNVVGLPVCRLNQELKKFLKEK